MDGVLSWFSLAGETAIVTGGTRGIGRAMAEALAEAGADIIFIQRDTTNTEAKAQIEARGRKAYIYSCELSSQAAVEALVPAIVADGLEPTILVNCAGIQHRSEAEALTSDAWEQVMQVNLNSVFALCKTFGAYLLSLPDDPSRPRRGSIINVASILAFQGGLFVAAYVTSKGGLIQLTRALSNEWAGRGIHVNAVAPGYVRTDLTSELQQDEERNRMIMNRIPAGRWGLPEDMKGVAVWLASRASQWVHGQVITVDGGWMGR